MVSALALLSMLAGISILGSDLPRWAAWPMMIGVVIYGLWKARMEARRSRHAVVIAAGDGSSTIDGAAVDNVNVTWRGALAFVSWRDCDDAAGCLVFWPDTLHAAQRRELRLAVQPAVSAPRRASMAP